MIIIKFIPKEEHRYETTGDYWWNGDILEIRVTKTNNKWIDYTIAIHELVEAILTKHRGIKEKDITSFDRHFEENGGIGEPGDQIDSPYRKEHHEADIHERMLATSLGIYLET